MAAPADFVGMTVTVTLKEPAAMLLHGRIADVLGQTLFLHNVLVPATGQRFAQHKVDSFNIADLEVAPPQPESQSRSQPQSRSSHQRGNSIQALKEAIPQAHLPRDTSGGFQTPHDAPQRPRLQGEARGHVRVGSLLLSPPARQENIAAGPPRGHPPRSDHLEKLLGPEPKTLQQQSHPGYNVPQSLPITHLDSTQSQPPLAQAGTPAAHGQVQPAHTDRPLTTNFLSQVLGHQQQAQAQWPRQTQPSQDRFVDPAILSFGKRPGAEAGMTHVEISAIKSPETAQPAQQHSAPQEFPSTPVKLIERASQAPMPSSTSPFVGVAKAKSTQRKGRQDPGLGITQSQTKRSGKVKNAEATLSAPFLGLNSEKEDADLQTGATRPRRVSISKTRSGLPMEAPVRGGDAARKVRRGRRTKKKDATSTEADQRDAHRQTDTKGDLNADGWRQTPMLQAPHEDLDNQVTSAQPAGIIGGSVGREAIASTRKRESKKTRRQLAAEKMQLRAAKKSGWGTEDATDIQELPEFDFIGNLSKFDKRSVFDAIRNEDTTADEDRLVSFNRLPGPQDGMRKMHHTENVLDDPHSRVTLAMRRGQVPASPRKNSLYEISDDSLDYSYYDEEVSALDSGRRSQQAMSRTSSKQPVPTHSARPQPVNLRSNSSNSRPRRQAGAAAANKYGPSASHGQIGSPTDLLSHRRASPPISPAPLISNIAPRSHSQQHSHPQQYASRNVSGTRPTKPCFRLSLSSRACPSLTPRQLDLIETTACQAPYYLSREIISETAGRGIAQVALNAINPGGKRLARENLRLNGRPVIVVLAGRTRGGVRALIAARLLAARGARLMCVIVGIDAIPTTGSTAADDISGTDGVGTSWEEVGGVGGEGTSGNDFGDPHHTAAATTADHDVALRLRAEIRRVQGAGGQVGTWALVRSELRRLDKPPELIIDALLGPRSTPSPSTEPLTDEHANTFSFLSLPPVDQALILDLVRWTNASRASVLSVESPSGLDGVTGRTHVLEGEPLEVRARYVVCLGAPRVGLLRALEKGEGGSWIVWCVDLGVAKAWRAVLGEGAAGVAATASGIGRSVRFGGEWVIGLRFDDGMSSSSMMGMGMGMLDQTGGRMDGAASVAGLDGAAA